MSKAVKKSSTSGKCPVMHTTGWVTEGKSPTALWWPNSLKLDILHQHDTKTNPLNSWI